MEWTRYPAEVNIYSLAPARAALMVMACSVTACGPTPPLCPDHSKTPIAPSAGCLNISAQSLLVVKQLNGKLSIPGGKSQPSESARCSAHRETWEETGLNLMPGELITVFDTGFHLFHCERHAGSGKIDPPPRIEVRSAFYLPVTEFNQVEWRFPEQEELFRRLLDATDSPP